MVTWKYLKGEAKDFEGAPDWALYRDECRNEHFWSEGYSVGDRFEGVNSDDVWEYDGDEAASKIIAHRERVTSVNDDRLANDLRPRSIYKPDGTVQFGCIPADVNALIAERGSRYGKFADGAEIMRDLKHVMYKVDGWNNLTPSQKEALDMIQHKIGRILNGDPTYDDNWKDIAGYATLIVEELNGNTK